MQQGHFSVWETGKCMSLLHLFFDVLSVYRSLSNLLHNTDWLTYPIQPWILLRQCRIWDISQNKKYPNSELVCSCEALWHLYVLHAWTCCWDLPPGDYDQLRSDVTSPQTVDISNHAQTSPLKKKTGTSAHLFMAVKLTNKSHQSKLSSGHRGILSSSLLSNSSPISSLIHYLPIWMDPHPSRTPQLSWWIQFVIHPLRFIAKEAEDKICLILTTSG